jgi:bifunctional non-homologous end joining protein LigD
MDEMREIRERLDPFIIRNPPLDEPIKKPKATWVKPVVRAEVTYGGVTKDGLLRELVFKGLRNDLSEPEPALPATVQPSSGVRGVPKENILQLLPGAPVPTKDQLATYWTRVARKALKYLGRRPLKLVRHVQGTTFYHKGPLPEIPDSVHRLTVPKREGGEGTRLWVDDVQGPLGLVEIGAVELHPWNSTVDDLEHPNVFSILIRVRESSGPLSGTPRLCFGSCWRVKGTVAVGRSSPAARACMSWCRMTGL